MSGVTSKWRPYSVEQKVCFIIQAVISSSRFWNNAGNTSGPSRSIKMATNTAS